MTNGSTTTTYAYDLNNRLLSETTGTAVKNYTYDVDGNTLTAGNESYTYDVRNRQIGYTDGTTTASYAYNPKGLRSQKTVGGATKYFVWDGMNIVYEYDASAGTAYYYGLHRVSAGNSLYYLYNAHGDVVQLTDGTGAVTKSYAYDAFGNEVNPDASDTNPFRYCGEYYDVETGTIYLRARYYDPVVGRFLSEDTHWNINNRIYGDDPLKLNKYTVIPSVYALLQSSNLYVYCINNPNYYVDITGNFIISVSTLLIAGGALVFGTIGGFVGNKVAENNGAEGWDKAGYIAGGALIGAVGGGALGAVAAPAVVSATGVAGISVSSAGITGIVAGGTTLSPALLDLYNRSVSHIFSNDHIKKGIMQLGTDKIDIFNKIINITNKHSDKWDVGSNEIRTVINNIEVTIRFNVVDNVIRSINAFVGYSERVIGNLINLNK